MDFDGGFLLGSGNRCDPLSSIDTWNRDLLLFLPICVLRGRENLTRSLLERAFQTYGRPGTIQTDNAPPFWNQSLGGLTQLSVWLLEPGIVLDRSEPGCRPEYEDLRPLHQTIKRAACNAPAMNGTRQQELLDEARRDFNEARSGAALQFKAPSRPYHGAQREWTDRKLDKMSYDENWGSRVVMTSGHIEWNERKVATNPALAGERVVLEPLKDGVWRMWFGSHALGLSTKRAMRLPPSRTTTPLRSVRNV